MHRGAEVEDKEYCCGTEELREVDQEVLIVRMDAVLSEIAGVKVVDEIVPWREDDGPNKAG